MWKKLALAAAAIVACLLVYVAMQPSEFRVARSQTIAAPAADVFALVNDFHKWDAWSPWAKLDPAMKSTFEGPPSGTGAVYHWVGNDEVGEGRMTIVESQPSDRIRIKLEFMKPFAAVNDTLFTFRQTGDQQTTVEWAMSGENAFLAKAIMMLMGGIDKAVGGDFEKGLAQMKAAAEKR